MKLGCSKNFDKCAMDMTTFPQVYITLMIEMNERNCEKYSVIHFTECYTLTLSNFNSKGYNKHAVNALL